MSSLRRVYVVSLVLAICLILGIVEVIRFFSPRTGAPTDAAIYVEKILNGIELARLHSGTNGSYGDPYLTSEVTVIYNWLMKDMPDKETVLQYLNSQQRPDGTWTGTVEGSYERNVKLYFILLAYRYLSSAPMISLDSYFATLNDYGYITRAVETYSPNNYWGVKFSFVMDYLVYYLKPPPWISEYWTEVESQDQTWLPYLHQRDHALIPYLDLHRPIPSLEDVINLTLAEQRADGSWGELLTETSIALHFLRGLNVSRPDVEAAVLKARPFVESTYIELVYNQAVYGAFRENPTYPATYSLEVTIRGLAAAINSGLIAGNASQPFQAENLTGPTTDLNGDGRVNMVDIAMVAPAFGTQRALF